jgi:hypothetical protein
MVDHHLGSHDESSESRCQKLLLESFLDDQLLPRAASFSSSSSSERKNDGCDHVVDAAEGAGTWLVIRLQQHKHQQQR